MLLGIMNKSYYTRVHETNTGSSIDLSIDLMESTNNERRGFKVETYELFFRRFSLTSNSVSIEVRP